MLSGGSRMQSCNDPTRGMEGGRRPGAGQSLLLPSFDAEQGYRRALTRDAPRVPARVTLARPPAKATRPNGRGRSPPPNDPRRSHLTRDRRRSGRRDQEGGTPTPTILPRERPSRRRSGDRTDDRDIPARRAPGRGRSRLRHQDTIRTGRRPDRVLARRCSRPSSACRRLMKRPRA